MRTSSPRGAALAEALIASLILTTGVLTMAQLVSMATRSNTSARFTTIAAILAAQKIEQLRGTDLQASPPGALARNTPGFVDYIDPHGSVVGAGAGPPPQAVYTRRWSIEALTLPPGESLMIQVLVLPGQARVVTLKTRKPW